MSEKIYSAGIMSQSFWFNEFKQFLGLVKEEYDVDETKRLIIEENLFGAPNEYRAKRIYGYISNRAKAIEPELLNLFFSSDLSTQKIINLISVIRKDRLFFEFLYEVYREIIIIGEEKLNLSDGKTFFNHKETQDDSLAEWKDATKRRVQSAYFNFMAEANLLRSEGQKDYTITPPLLDIALKRLIHLTMQSVLRSIKTVFVPSGIFFGIFLLLTKRNTPKMACPVPFRDVSCGRGRRT